MNVEWNWEQEKIARWLEPAMEMPWLALRWKSLGFRELLDSGCGPGRHAMFFAKQGFSATGLDKSQMALDHLTDWAAREHVTVSAVLGDLGGMPFADNTFDCVVDYNASYHTDTAGYFRAVRELKRVLKPGGEVFLTLLSRRDDWYQNAVPEDKLDRFTLCHAGGTPHFYGAKEDFAEIFEGFSLIIPSREVIAPGIDNSLERIHFQLLLRKDEAS